MINTKHEIGRDEIVLNLCKTHTNLSDGAITKLQRIGRQLERIAKQRQIDVFIDCPCTDSKEVIVVAQAMQNTSLYESSTVGYIIREEDEPAVFRSFRFDVKTEEVKAVTAASASNNMVVQTVLPIFHEGDTIGVLIYERAYAGEKDFLQNESAPQPLRCYDKQPVSYPYLKNLDWLGDCMNDGILIIDQSGVVSYRNDKARKIYQDYGYVNDICGKEYWRVSLHGRLGVMDPDQLPYKRTELLLKGEFYRFSEYRIEGDAQFFLVVIQNRTAENRSENMEQIHTAFMREVNHRIKNGLQTIYSLLDMQKRRIADETVATILQDAMNRIMSMIATQKNALLSRDTLSVNLRELIQDICACFLDVVRHPGLDININMDCANIEVESETAETLALVINELLQNACKHAFIGRMSGNILVSVILTISCIRVVVQDDGIGFSPESLKNPFNGNGMGLRIVNMLVQGKLGGKVWIASDENGAKITFECKNKDERQVSRYV